MNAKRIKKALSPLAFLLFPKMRPSGDLIATGYSNPTVDFVTTWNERCGIAAYSSSLISELRKSFTIRIVPVSHAPAFSPYFFVLGLKLGRNSGLIHIQFAYDMFTHLNLGKKRILAFSAFLFYLGLALSAHKANHVITTFHDPLETINRTNFAGYAYLKAQAFLLCVTSDIVIALNEKSGNQLISNYGVPKSKIKTIPIGCIEKPQFMDKKQCKETLHLAEKTVLTLPGFVIRNKGHDMIIKIMPLLGENVKLLIAGGAHTMEDALYLEELKDLARRNNVADKVVFDDSFPITSTVMNATDIALLPYKQANESMMVRDLISFRVPTIASNIPIFEKIKDKYDCIELFEEGNAEDLLKKINALILDKKKQASLRSNCDKMWNDDKWSSIANKHLEPYLEAMAAVPEDIYYEERQKERINWLKENLSGPSLEIGCATGYVTNGAGADIGLDLNQYRVRVAKLKYPSKEFIIASAENLPFKQGAFSTVIIPEILEHVPLSLATKILIESNRVGSEILITLPNAEKPNHDKNIVENPEHKWYPTQEIVKKLVGKCVIQYSAEKDFMFVTVRKT